MPSLKSFEITLGDINYLIDQMRDAIKVVSFDAQGRPIYGFYDSIGGLRTLGLFGTFDPLAVVDPTTGLSIYDGAREASGFRIPVGFFNNLVDVTRWTWGSTNQPFPRLTAADYSNYVHQSLTNPALTTYQSTHLTFTPVADNASNYANPSTTVIDYTPRMITQTISTSYGANTPATATGIAAAATDAASTVMSPGELLVINIASSLIAFQFYDSALSPNPTSGNVVGIDVTSGRTVAQALADIQNALSNTTVGVSAGHISVALNSETDGSLAIFDNAGLGLSGNFSPTISNASALLRTGAWTDIVTSENVLTATGPATVTEYIVRNLNTLPGDPSTSGIFTLFGQFFDHGLDFIDKGGQGAKIVIPLAPTDPLYRAPGTNSASDPGNTTITISRATPDGYTMLDIHGRQVSIAGADKVFGTADDVQSLGANGELGGGDDVLGPAVKPAQATYTDHTSPYIDQSQSYGSDTQITRLLRQWIQDPNTGNWRPGADLLDGHQTQAYNSQVFNDASPSGLGAGMTTRTVPTLNELRAHMAATGRTGADALTWDDINNYRARDDAGHLIDTNGAAAGGFVYTGQAILLDMNPNFAAIDFSNATIASGGVTAANFATFVDFSNFTIKTGLTTAQYAAVSEALMQSVGNHYVAGDGRANENFGLTALHHVFHENHNVQLINLETIILTQADLAHRNAYQLSVGKPGGGFYTDAQGNYTLADGVTISWDPDKMFEATKLINEMEYQHVAIDQYARLVTPDLPEFVTYDSDINANISLEYSQAAFRFGHSQLRETIDTIDPNGMVTKWALSNAFLNPAAFAASGAENIIRGMSQQLSNEVDEFITPALQQSLLGQPLDLGAINIARGRDLGIPTLNEARRQLHDALVAERAADPNTPHHTNLIVDALNPYTSWAEFGSQMQHPESLVNFVAAYAFDGNLDKANAIIALEGGTIAEGSTAAMGYTVQDAIGFLNNSYSGGNAELTAGAATFNDIDLWIGGLAELHVFTGQVGTTFNAIFEDQMERLMDGDRFYYLYRLQDALAIDTDLGHAVVTEQFKDIIERTTGALHLNGDVMGYADSTFELAKTHAADLSAHPGLGIYSGSGSGTAGNGTIVAKSNGDLGLVNQQYIADFRPDTGENPDGTPASGYNSHEVFAGTDFNDWLDAGNGDDTIYGDKGNDVLDGKAGADHIYGGDGQDVIYGGDIEDFLDGGRGDDIVYAGTSAGALDVVIGGDGNDKLYGEAGIDEIYGGAGDDYIDAGGDTDLAFGDAGNDVMFGGDGPDELRGGLGDDQISGGSGADVLKGEGGDDILFGGIGQNAQNGDGDELLGSDGFDVAAYSDTSIVLDAAADLRNQNLVAAGGTTPFNPYGQLLVDIEGVIASKFDDKIIGDDTNNWFVGGGGNDTFNTTIANTDGIVGEGGNDVVVGDKIRLDTLIGTYGGYQRGFDALGNAIHGVTGSLTGGLLGNAALGTQMFDKHFTDLLQAEKNKDYILGNDTGVAGSSDKAIFTGNFADYTLTAINYVGAHETVVAYKIVDNRAGSPDGTDLLIGVDTAQFADGSINLNHAPVLDLHAFDITSGTFADNFNGVNPARSAANNSTGTTPWTASWTEAGDGVNNILTDQIQIDGGGSNGTNQLRLFDNGDGASIQRVVNLAGATAVTTSFDVGRNSFDNGESIVASFTADSAAAAPVYHVLRTITATSSNNSANNIDLLALLNPGETLTANAAIKFEAFTSATNTGTSSNNGYVSIDNFSIAFTKQTSDSDPFPNFTTTFTAGGVAANIAVNPLITDDGPQLVSAKVVLTNALPGDALNGNDLAGDGITVSPPIVSGGQITLNLSGAASLAAYQAAVQAITFSNNTSNPSTADRTITVTVNDGLNDSNIATTTVHVYPVNNPPNAVVDAVVTNVVGGGAVAIPDWVLLANDTDPDGQSLAFSAIVSTNSANATHAATSVTFNDTGTSATNNGGTDNGSMGSFVYRVTDNALPIAGTDTASVVVSRDTGDVSAGAGRQIIVGDAGSNTFSGGAGNDIVLAGAGNDTINWNVGDGSDFIDGGANDAAGDRFVVSGNASAETFRIYTRAAALAAGMSGLNANTEIVVTRNGVTNAQIVAQLDNIEEITINTLDVTANNNNGGLDGGPANGDTVAIIGDFTGTSLNYSTITVNGGSGDDQVDISGLTSDHRIVFHSGSGHDSVIGTLRPQDVIDHALASQNTTSITPAAPITGSGEQLLGTPNDDVIIGHDTNTYISADSGADIVKTGNQGVTVDAGGGADVVDGGSGDDIVFGGTGNDTLSVGGGNDKVWGGGGDDIVDGGDGDNQIWGDDGADLITTGSGKDIIFAGDGDDDVNGGAGADRIFGGDGADSIAGGVGDDRIEGGLGADVMSGGDGNDTFIFRSTADADGDVISDFRPGDVIDLHFIDATAATADNAAFTIVNATSFSKAGELIIHLDAATQQTIVEGNTDADKTTAEFRFALTGDHVNDLHHGLVV